jgi:hypothetical protein
VFSAEKIRPIGNSSILPEKLSSPLTKVSAREEILETFSFPFADSSLVILD